MFSTSIRLLFSVNTGEVKMNIGKDLYLKEVQKIRYENLCNVLGEYEKQGIKVSVQGMCFPIKKSAKIMSVSDGDCYMPDMILDKCGKLIEINYDRIVQK